MNKLMEAVLAECDKRRCSITALGKAMGDGFSNEQLSRWMHGHKTPNRWNRKAINQFFNREIYPE